MESGTEDAEHFSGHMAQLGQVGVFPKGRGWQPVV